MAAVREGDPRSDDDPDVVENARREAAMRRALRAAMKEKGVERVAFVCGAYHAPALDPAGFPPQARDNELLAGLPKTKVAATWVPWSSGRLAFASGYGAGVTSPGWYQHLFDHWSREQHDDSLATSWLVRVARELRGQQLDASTASIVEASRLATALAAMRGRPSVGLSELDDAAEAVLCEGSRVPLGLVHDSLVVGRELGAVPERAPMVPLAADLQRQQRRARLKPAAASQTVVLDLRRENQRARSVLLHRLRLLGVDWGTEADAGGTTGTFKEAWQLEWRPELAVAVIEAGLFGTTVAAAAAAKVTETAGRSDDLATLGRLVSQCLLADLPDGLRSVVAALEERTAKQHDVLALLGAVEPLARTTRYGDVRGVDVGGVAHVLRALVLRAAIGLPAACVGLDDDAAAAVRDGVEAAHRGVALLDDGEMRDALDVRAGGGGRARPGARLGGGTGRPAAARRRPHRPGRRRAADEPAALGRRPGRRRRRLAGRLPVGRVGAARARPGATGDRRRVGQRHRGARLRGPPAAATAYVLPVPAARAPLDRRVRSPGSAAGERHRPRSSERLDLERARPAVDRVAALLGLGVADD